jgi:hypothetical protein
MATLSLDKAISSVSAVQNLQNGHPVFLLVADDASHLVIKQESTTDTQNLKHNLTTMAMASPKARSVILTQPEVNVLKVYIAHKGYMINTHNGPPFTGDENTLNTYLSQVGTWFKMKEAVGYTDLGRVASQLLNGDKSGVRKLANALNDSNGLEALGKIVAADLFNNNNDRFALNMAGPIYVRQGNADVRFNMQVLVNIGNVMAATSGSKLRLIGLDSWDPSAEGINDMNADPTPDWTGRLLAPDKEVERLNFATAICGDLEMLLGTRNRRFDFLQQTRLNKDADKRIAKGMNKMRAILVAAMVRTLKRGRAPAGITSRLAIVRGH